MAKGSDLNIELTSVLNIGKSLKSINDSIKAIEKSTSLKNVKLKAIVDDKQLQKSIENAVKKLNASLNLNVKGIQDANNQIDNIQKKMKTFVNMKDSQFINPKVEKQAFNEISGRIRDIRKNVDELAKVDITTNRRGQMTGASLTYYNQELGKTVTETMGWREAQKMVNGELVKFKSFETLSFKYSDNMAKARRETEKFAQSAKNLELFKQKMLGDGDYLGQLDIFASKQKGRYNEASLMKLRYEISTLNKDTPELKNKIKQLNQQFSSLKQVASESGSVLVRAMENAGKFLRFYLVGGFLVGIVGQLRNALDTLKLIDTELVNIAKVTNYTNQEMKELTQTAIDAGKEFGRTAQEYLKSVTEFARAGMGKQSEEYAKLSLLLQNVGDVTSEVANETLIAANAGFQLGGSYEALMGIIDKFNLVSNQNATSVSKMSDAMKVGASVFNAAGLSIDETIALIGTATASTQRSGSEISRGWRTILMNIRQVVDEEAEVTEDSMKKAEKALNSIGIVVRDSPSTFRPMFEIIRDLGNEWKNLTEVEQSYVAESLAGKRQANILISTLQNWSMAEKQLQESINSSGSALKENEIYMESWEAKAKQLSTSATDFWSNFINTDAVKDSIGLLSQLINVLNVLINNPVSSFITQTALLTTSIKLLNIGLKTLRTSTFGTIVGLVALDVTQKGLIVTTKALTASMLASPLFYPIVISASIVGLIKLIGSLNKSFKEQKEIITTLSTEISTLQSEYDQLSTKGNRTEEEEKYLKLLEAELQNKRNQIKENTKLLVQEKYFASQKVGNIRGGFIYTPTGISEIQKNIDKLNELRDKLNNTEFKTPEEFKKVEADLIKLEEALISTAKELYDEIEILGKDAPPELQKFYDIIIALTNKTEDQSTAATNATSSNTSYKTSLEELQKTLSKSSSTISEVNSALDEYNDTGKFNLDTLIKLSENYPQLLAVMGDEKAVRQELTKIIEDEQETAKEAYMNMLQNSEDFYNAKILGNAKLVQELNDKYGVDLNNYKSLAEAKLAVDLQLIKKLASEWSDFYDAQGKFIGEIAYKTSDGKLINNFYDAVTYKPSGKDNILNDIFGFPSDKTKNVTPYKIVYDSQGNAKRVTEDMTKQRADLKKATEEAKKAFDNILLKNTNIDFSKIGLGKTKKSSSPSPIENQYESKELTQQYNAQIEMDKAEEKSLQRKIKLAEKQKDYNKAIELNNKLLQVQKKIIEDIRIANEKITKRAQELRDQNKNYNTLLWFDVNGETTDEYVKLIDKFSGKTDKASKQELKNIENLHDAIKTLKQAYNGNIETLYQYQDAIDATTQSIEDFQKKSQDEIVKDYKRTYEKQKDIELEAIQDSIDAEDERHENRMEHLEEEYQEFEDSINKQLALIDKQSDKEDYQKNLSKLQSERQALSDRISLLSLNNSIENKKTLEELRKELADKNEEIEELQNDRSKELRKENLKDQLDTYKDDYDENRKSEDKKYKINKDFLNKKKDAVEDAYDYIFNVLDGNIEDFKSGFNGLKEFLGENAKYFTGDLTRDLTNPFIAMLAELQKLKEEAGMPIEAPTTNAPPSGWTKSSQGGYHITIGGTDWGVDDHGNIYKDNKWYTGNDMPDEVRAFAKANKGSESSGGSSSGSSSKSSGVNGTIIGDSGKAIQVINGKLTGSDGKPYTVDENGNLKDKNGKVIKKVQVFQDGGTVDYTGLAMLHGSKSRPEAVFNTNQLNNLINMLSDPFKYSVPQPKTPTFAGASGGGGSITNQYHLELKIANMSGSKKDIDRVSTAIITNLKKIGAV